MFYAHASWCDILISASNQERQQTEQSWFTFPESLQTSNSRRRAKNARGK